MNLRTAIRSFTSPLALLFALFSALALGACGGSKAPDQAAASTSGQPDPIALARADVAALDTMSVQGPARVEQAYPGTFTAIFGGTSGAEVKAYYQARVRQFVDSHHTQVMPGRFANRGWLASPADFVLEPSVSEAAMPKNYQLGAANVGTQLWLEGLINQVSVSLRSEAGDTIAVDSSRAGIIAFGSGYEAYETDADGQRIDLPAAYRQAILLHEARHSDCTGGITEAQLVKLRAARNTTEYEQSFATMPCGHLHRICQEGELKGIAACDVEPWGAYTVGAVYALAAMSAAPTTLDRNILHAQFVDQMSRVQVDARDLFAGRLGRPDMTSQGYRAEDGGR